jgi:hypothetical protein
LEVGGYAGCNDSEGNGKAMMNRKEARGAYTCVGRLGVSLGLGIVACATTVEQEGMDGAESSSQALLGDPTFIEGSGRMCTLEEQEEIKEGTRLGRISSRSTAFAECLSRSANEPTPFFEHNRDEPGSTFGPYMACEGDALEEAAFTDQVGRLMSASATLDDVEHFCGASCSGGAACASVGSGRERIGWRTVTVSAADDLWGKMGEEILIWHETGHTNDYSHDGCGFPNATYHSGANLLGFCVKEVTAQSLLAPECAALQCESREMAIVRHYGEYDVGDACECVPDVYRWPFDENEAGDHFGASMAVGDFNGDGFDDLAVGAPGEGSSAGSVYTFRGSEYGLRFWERLTQFDVVATNYSDSSPSAVRGTSTAGDEFGYALAAADFDADGYDDLAIGSPGEVSDEGVVHLVRGSAIRLRKDAAQLLDQRETGGATESDDRFGASLVAADFTGDNHADLVVGAPFERFPGTIRAGVASAHKGQAAPSGSARIVIGDGLLSQEMGLGFSNRGDEYGASLAAANTANDTSVPELFVGAPGENGQTGHIFVYQRGSAGWSTRFAFTNTASTRFGQVIQSGNVNASGSTNRPNVLVEAPDATGTKGEVYVYNLSTTSATLAQTITSNESGDRFGASIAVGRFNGDAKQDFVVGLPGETFGSGPREGRILRYLGTTSATIGTYSGDGDQDDLLAVDEDSVIPLELRGDEHMGATVATGRFYGGTRDGVAVGAPEDVAENGASAGALFFFTDTIELSRKIDQVSMRHGSVNPIR